MSLSWIPLLPHIIQALTGRRPSVQRGTDDKTQSYRYDVFISFRGPDTRNTFVDHLYSHLIRKGIFTFKDDKQLQKGESISPQLLQAIQHSRCSIIVFSKDYASSTWCLDEMAAIADCRAKFKQIVFPVFYDVDPSHVRNQNGVFENAFVLHTEKFKDDPHKVDGWKRAMTCFAGLTGWDVRNKQEVEEIENIVQTVIEKLGHKFSGYADDLIGIQPQVRALEKLLKLSSHDDRCLVLGIWGMDGIGKTTLATVLYDTISHHYQFGACCFIENVSTIYREDGAIAVQKQILHQTLKEKNLDAYSRSEISGIIINRLKNIKVLIVLDDVDSFVQLQELHLNPRLLHPESRIIITTIDLNILELYGADKIHKVELMNYIDARKLLCRKAFQSDNSSSDYAELIPKVLEYAQGLPLAIRVMGSFLFNRDTKKWRATLDGLEKNPNSGTMKVLQSSFEGLENREREIFLHVACFFEGEREDYVRRILHACELQPDIGISLIVEKSFITIRNQEIHMHKILQELGKQIVRKEHPDEPRLWSRLWLYRDLNDAIRKLDLPNLKRMELSNSKNLKVTPRFEGMQNLERLDLTGCINLSVVHPSIGLLTKLEFLSLQNCTSLVTLVFRYAPRLMSLRVLSLSGCTKLENTLNFTELSNLQYLDMDRCASLSTIHESVEALEELTFLSLRECTNLVGIPDGLNNMTSLTTLDLYGCLKFTNLPLRVVNDHSSLESLIFLDLSFCNISKVPKDIGKLRCLERLNLQGNKFTELPSSLSWLDNLSYLNLSHCHKLQSLRYLPKRSGQSNSAGRYFKTTSESRNHRSGLYVFDSPNCTQCRFFVNALIQRWILTMFEEPLSFRCGFDIVLPWYKNTSDSVGNHFISIFFHHRFEGGSIVRINDPVMDVCLGFLFYVTFELNNHPVLSSSSHQSLSSSLPHPFYLSFESEYTEERFDMPLNLELNKIDGLNYIWVIYISQEHCHFVKTGAHITFKARQGLIIKEWGLLPLTKINTEEGGEIEFDAPSLSLENVNIKQRSSGSSCMPKIQFPYNWFVSDKDEAERDEAKGKETDLFNLGLLTESSQLL
ncbi:disease resistance protein RUN1-like isoform X2 [Trifolium pratense]|uniref:disease resistance protein RUN1-like isoform X2 n=1 Tax=Trifolium pratense TaxID=57577 RepID=UPI001E693FCD|nr:disease resistance protein RUN1-like isoform X2 [Trifolium pratense]